MADKKKAQALPKQKARVVKPKNKLYQSTERAKKSKGMG